MVKGLAYHNEAMSHALQDYPKTDKSQWGVLTKCGPLEEGMANYSSILDQRSPWAVWKGKKTWHQKMSPRGQVSNMLLEKCGGQLLIVPEKMKVLGQSANEAPLQMGLLVKVKSSALENNIRTSNVSSINQEKLDVVKQEMALKISSLWNQWTKVDGNGQI